MSENLFYLETDNHVYNKAFLRKHFGNQSTASPEKSSSVTDWHSLIRKALIDARR